MDPGSVSPPADGAEISFKELIAALLDPSNPFPAKYLYRLSDLIGQDLEKFNAIWPEVDLGRRQRLLEDLELFAESDSLVSFEAVFSGALNDPDPEVRLIAMRALWETDNFDLVPEILRILEHDSSPRARAQAAATLGYYIYLGEIGKLAGRFYSPIVDKLLSILDSGEDARVRRNALESLGFSSHTSIPSLLEEAYGKGDEDWLASSLMAMGRSADEVWRPLVVKNLTHSDSKVRLEASQSAGLLSTPEAVPLLFELIYDEDDEVRLAAIWSISEIGGEGVQDALEQLLIETESEDETEIIGDALENLAFTQENEDFNMLSFSENDFDDLINLSPDEG